MSEKKRLPNFAALWLLVALGLAIIMTISFAEELKIGSHTVKRGTFKETLLADNSMPADAIPLDTLELPEEEDPVVLEPDTTVKSLFLFGDSMTILLARRMAAYGEMNGYKVSSVTWDGSSSIGWSGCDTLERYLNKYKPDFIMISLGGNELYLKNFESRLPYIEKLLKKIGDTPFVWIGPPTWKDDQSLFNDMLEQNLPKGTFFRTEGMDLKRGPDHIHPVQSAADIWVDSIMRWMPSTAHPILSEFPDSTIKQHPAFNSHHIPAGGRKKKK